jgi:hypothetical protein
MFDRNQGSRNNNQSGNNDDWKANAFLNVFLPRKNGTRMKLGFFPLKETNIDQQKLITWIKEDPETRLASLLQKLVIEFHEVGSQDESDLDL